MAKDQNRRLTPSQLKADTDSLTALQSIGDYAPANSAYAKTAVASALNAMKAAQEAEINAANALATASDAAASAE